MENVILKDGLYIRSIFVPSVISWFILVSLPKTFSADADVRLARRIRRDTVEKGRDIGMVLDQVGRISSLIQKSLEQLALFSIPFFDKLPLCHL